MIKMKRLGVCLRTPAANSSWLLSEISASLVFIACCVTPPDFNAACVSLVHQTCSQGADDEAEHRTKYYEPDCCICDGRPVRFESHLCLHFLSSAEPELIKNAQDRERQSAQHKDNFFDAVVPNDRCVVHDFGIATK